MKRVSQLLILISLALPVLAQVAVTPATIPHITFVNGAGGPCATCSLYTYGAGTTTPLATYTDSTGTSQNHNPIILDAAGGANIWLGANSYKFILKDSTGTTIWSVDNVNAGNIFPCSSAGAIQIANSSGDGLTCDSSITINTVTHTINVGTLPANYATIGALGTPTSWTFDTTSPATALASLGAGAIGSGTANQIAIYPSTGNNVTGSSSIPDGITGITRGINDQSTNPATTAYVENPGFIAPTGLAINSGVTLTDNQGTGSKLQHSSGTITANHCVQFDSSGNTVDSGAACATGGTPRTCNANGCYRIEQDGTIEEWGVSASVPTGADANSVTVTFPFPFTTTTNLSYVAWADSCATTPCNTSNKNPLTISGDGSGVSTTGVVNFVAGVVPTGGGGVSLGSTIHIHWHAIGN